MAGLKRARDLQGLGLVRSALGAGWLRAFRGLVSTPDVLEAKHAGRDGKAREGGEHGGDRAGGMHSLH